MRNHLLTLAIAVIISWLLIMGAMRHFAPEVPKIPKQETSFERVTRTRTIRCAFVAYPPGFIRDANTGALSGIFHDMVEEAARRMSFKVDWVEEVNFGSYIEGFKTNRYDALCSSGWASAAESPQVLYSIPVYYSGVGIYVRADDDRFTAHPEMLNDAAYTFGVSEGSLPQAIVNTDFPAAKQNSLPVNSDVSLILLSVASSKADAAVSEAYMANAFLAKNPGTLKNIVPQKPIRVFPNTVVFNNDDPRLKHMIDGALSELLNSGYIDKLIDQYETYPGSLYRMAQPYR